MTGSDSAATDSAIPAAETYKTMATYEKYGTTLTGVDLYWYRYEPVGAPGQKFPAIIGLHPGGYHAGTSSLQPQGSICSQQGFLFLGAEYRLAPPHNEMDTDAPFHHPSPGQNTVSDDGFYPEHGLDVRMAIIAARADPMCDGRVYGLGGSAGASHVLYNMLTATDGIDKFDLGVCCSIGVFDLYRSEIWSIPCSGTETCPHSAIANYLNIADTFPAAPTGADLTTAKNASPSFIFNASKLGGKIWVMLSDRDSRGIPTSSGVAIPSYDKNGSLAVDEGSGGLTVATGFFPVAIAAGMTESTLPVPEAGLKYKKTVVPVGVQGISHAHAFNYWSALIDPATDPSTTVKEAIITWFLGGVAQTAEEPTITSFEPESGFAGVTPVVITGTNFDNASGVRFNHEDALSFNVDSSTQITAIPPIGASTGLISVRTPVDTTNSATEFTVETQTIEDDPDIEPRQPILNYPVGGLPPIAPARPSPPRNVDAHASGVAGSHAGQATWTPPGDTSGATLLDYIAYLTSESGATGTVPAVPGNAVDTELDDLEVETVYQFHIAAVTIYGISDEVVVEFTSNPRTTPTVKDEPRGSLCLLASPLVNGKHVVDYNPTNFWPNVHLMGSRFRTSWGTLCTNPLDPTDQTYYDWTDLDAYMALCTTYNKIAGISVAAGIYCPPWIYANPRIKLIDEHGPDAGLMPIPWNQEFLDLWIEFIRAFGDRYDNHPQLSYFVVGGLGQVIETELATQTDDLGLLLADAQLRGFDTIEAAWLYAANRILFACQKAFKKTRFLLSLAKVVPDSWGSGGEGSQGCFDVFDAGRAISLTNFGVMNAGLNANSNGNPGGFPPNVIIHDNSAQIACGFQFGQRASDETDFQDTNVAGATTCRGKFLEMYVPDATSVDAGWIADIDNANILLAANP